MFRLSRFSRAEPGLRAALGAATASLFLVTAAVADAAPSPPPFMRRADPLEGAVASRSARAALDALLPHARALELLELDDIALEGGARLVRFEQRHHGAIVLGRGATVRVDQDGVGKLAAARLETALPDSNAPLLDVDRAMARASARVKLPHLGRGTLAVLPTPSGLGQAVFVWRFEPRFAGLPFAPQVLVDARTGKVLVARDRAVSAAPAARVYSANPTRTPGLERLPFPLPPKEDGAGRLLNDRIVAKTCVDKGAVLPIAGLSSGIRACALEQTALPGPDGDYSASPNDDAAAKDRNEDAFAEVSMYYHLGRVYSFFQGLAPPGTKRIVASTPFTAVANLRLADGLTGEGDLARIADPALPLMPFSNAFFAPGGDLFGAIYGVEGGALWFGQGKARDYAYDGDVVYHEFAHAVVDATLGLGFFAFDEQGLSAAPGALNEGLADMFAAALSGDPDIGEYAATDLHEGMPYVRTLSNADGCPTGIVGEVHFDSTAFSGALWAVRVSLSDVERVVFDRTLYEVMLTNPRFDAPTFEEFFAVLLETFRERASIAARLLERELTTRGLWPRCERLIDATGRTIAAPSDAAGRIGFQAPGQFETGLDQVPGAVTFRASVAGTGPRHLVVDFRARTRSPALVFEADGTPFQPVVLVRFDAPITYRGGSHDAKELRKKPEEAASSTFAIPVPEDAKLVYVQIANDGEKSGVYDAVELKVVPGAVTEASAPVMEVGAPARDDGCSSSPLPARTSGWPTFAFAVAMTGAAFALRRRR